MGEGGGGGIGALIGISPRVSKWLETALVVGGMGQKNPSTTILQL